MENKLKKLNFNNLLTLDTNINEYSFESYVKNGKRHPQIKKMCTLCEEKGINICSTDRKFSLRAMGHGASADDILTATGQKNINISGWKNEGVMFVLENPGPCYNKTYAKFNYNGYTKYPTHEWYFVNQKKIEKCEYPDNFYGHRRYGEFFCSVLFTFMLKNLYITDLVKCGMNDSKNKFKHISEYNQECVENCLKRYFYKEIQIVNPEVIFCLGHNSCNEINEKLKKIESLLKHKVVVKYLPHPNAWFSNSEFKEKYYNGIIDGLHESKIISDKEKNNFIKRGTQQRQAFVCHHCQL